MGYRSDGTWIIKGKPDDVVAAWAELLLNKPEYRDDPNILDDGPQELLAMFKVFKAGEWGYIRFSYDQWKWYDSYPSVQFLEAIWNRLESDGRLCGRRLRVGEESSDIENVTFDSSDGELDGYEIQLDAYTKIDDNEPYEGEPLCQPSTT